MKRTAVLGIVLVSLIGGAMTASAAPAKVKPVKMTQFLHGTQDIGEVQARTDGYGVMDAKAPTGSTAKTWGVANYVGGPNTECAGNSLFPVWIGAVSGAPVGDAVVELFLDTKGSGSLEIRLYADVDAQACNADHPVPIGSQIVSVQSGTGKVAITLKNINKKAKPLSSMMLQVTPVLSAPPYSSRVQYDSTTTPSRITFTCLPKAGKKTC